MPTDRVDDTSTVGTSSAETLAWNHLSSGAWASATGQAAGTIVTGKATYTGITNSLGGSVGSFNDTSLTLAAATRFDTRKSIPEGVLAEMQFISPTDQAAKVALYLLNNGEYAIDHRRGQIWGKSKDTVANDAITYKYQLSIVGSGGGGATSDIIKVGGSNVPVQNSAFGTATPLVPIAAKYMATPTTYDDGDAVPLLTDANGRVETKVSNLTPAGSANMAGSIPMTVATCAGPPLHMRQRRRRSTIAPSRCSAL